MRMTGNERPVIPLVALTACSLAWLGAGAAAAQQGSPTILRPVHFDISPPLRDIKPIPPPVGPPREKEEHELPPWINVPPQGLVPSGAPPPHTFQTWNGPLAMPSPSIQFEGLGTGYPGFAVGVAPPDTEGDVGLNHYIQWINISFVIFSKSGTTVYGPAAGNTLWSGFGGPCQADNDGDPIVQYDQLADRWVMAQFAVESSPYYQCIAVSTSPDPTGTWYRYAYSFGSNFNDYPKLAVWPDAYYATYNMFNGNTFLGAEACAYDRSKMLAGDSSASTQCFPPNSSYGGMLPADVDGRVLPPAGSPNYVVAMGGGSPSTAILLWKFHVDWTNPANSTFSGPTTLTVTSFSPACYTGTRQQCIQQDVTPPNRLEALSLDMMYRLAYRNMGAYEALVVNHSITGSSADSDIRWYEIRSPNSTPTIHQSGTYEPDSNARWMGSIAMDGLGDMAVGYSVSSSGMKPAIRYAGRLVGDPAGTLNQGETTLIAGTGAQNGGLHRWGDYSAMTVDPVDDCTFWYTQEYLSTDGSFNWRTRIGAFKFPSCSCPSPPGNLTADPTKGSNRIDLSWDPVTPNPTQYLLYRGTSPGGPYTPLATVAAPTTTYSDTSVVGGIPYYYVVHAYLSCESGNSNEASATAVGTCTAAPSFAGVHDAEPVPGSTCGVSLAWSDATSNCPAGGPMTYNVYRSPSAGFIPSAANRVMTGLTGTAYTDTAGVGATKVYYVVRAVDGANGIEDANLVRQGVTPAATAFDSESFESGSGLAGWSVVVFSGAGTDWRGVEACAAHSGSNVFVFGGATPCTGPYSGANRSGAYAAGGAIAIPSGTTSTRLSFWHRWDFNSGDGVYLSLAIPAVSSSYYLVPPVILRGPSYNGTTGACAAGAGRAVWTGSQPGFTNTVIDLDAACNYVLTANGLSGTGCAGRTLRVGVVAVTGCGTTNTGWFLDDFVVSGNAPSSACSSTPSDVQFLTVRSTNSANKLEWQNPATGAYNQAIVRYRTDGTYPTGPTDGSGVTCTPQDTANGHYNSCSHGTTPGTTYSYAVFVDGGSSLFSSGRHVRAGWPSLSSAVDWGYWTGAATLAPPGIRPGAIGSGAIYEVSNDRVFHAMNPTASGGDWPRTWANPWFPLAMNGPAQSRPPIIPDGLGTSASKVAFLGSQDGSVYAVDAEGGTELWASSPQPGDVLQAAPAGVFTRYGASWNLLFEGTRNAASANRLDCLDPANGHTLWSFDNGGGANAIGIISAQAWADYASNKVYFTSRAHAGGSAQTVWCVSFTDAAGAACSGFSPPTSIGDIDSSPVLYQGVLYIGTNAGTVYALDPDDGHTLATFATGDGAVKGFITPAFTALPRRLYLATTNTLWCLSHNDNDDTGSSMTELWDSGATIAGPSIPILRAGTNNLYAGSSDGALYQVDVTAPGSPKSVSLGTATVGSPAIDNTNGLLHVGTEAGVVYAVTLPLP